MNNLFGGEIRSPELEEARQVLEASPSGEFVDSLKRQLEERGFLSPKQLAWVLGPTPTGAPSLKDRLPGKGRGGRPQGAHLPGAREQAAAVLRRKKVARTITAGRLLAGREPNPVQVAASLCPPDSHLLIAAPTGTGKTLAAELAVLPVLRRGQQVAYISPLRALSGQKLQDWRAPGHPFSTLETVAVTGDQDRKAARMARLVTADLALLTSEMFDSLTRPVGSRGTHWLSGYGAVIVDEFHLLGVGGRRGATLESLIMRLTSAAPGFRLILLSGTAPQPWVEKVVAWLERISDHSVILVWTEWRSVPLTVTTEGGRTPEAVAQHVRQDLRNDPKSKALVFCPTRAAVRELHRLLQKDKPEGLTLPHHAGLSKEKRREAERRLLDDPTTRAVVCTTTLAMGVDLPVKRVYVAGLRRGAYAVEDHEVEQMIGRAGRKGYGLNYGIAKIFPDAAGPVPTSMRRKGFQEGNPMDEEALAAEHLLASFRRFTHEEAEQWADRMLNPFYSVSQLVHYLAKFHCVRRHDGGFWVRTPVGSLAVAFCMPPKEVALLQAALRELREEGARWDAPEPFGAVLAASLTLQEVCLYPFAMGELKEALHRFPAPVAGWVRRRAEKDGRFLSAFCELWWIDNTRLDQVDEETDPFRLAALLASEGEKYTTLLRCLASLTGVRPGLGWFSTQDNRYDVLDVLTAILRLHCGRTAAELMCGGLTSWTAKRLAQQIGSDLHRLREDFRRSGQERLMEGWVKQWMTKK